MIKHYAVFIWLQGKTAVDVFPGMSIYDVEDAVRIKYGNVKWIWMDKMESAMAISLYEKEGFQTPARIRDMIPYMESIGYTHRLEGSSCYFIWNPEGMDLTVQDMHLA